MECITAYVAYLQLKERSYLTMQEIFNKEEQNQLQQTKNVGKSDRNTFDLSRKH